MADPATNEEVMEAVTALRATVEQKGTLDQDKVDRINVVLDGYEAKNQALVVVEEQSKNQEKAIKELQESHIEYKEADEKRQVELKENIHDLELEIARGIRDHKSDNPEAYKGEEEYKSLNIFCKNGENNLTPEQKVLLRTDSAVDGGILAPQELDTQIIKKIVEVDPIRSIARVRTISSKSMEMAIRAAIPVAEYEGEAETGTDSAATYESVTVTPFRQTHTTPITKDMLMDAAFDMESEIASDAAEAFGFGEGNGFVLGTNFKQPEGFMTNAIILAATQVGTTGTAGVIPAVDVVLLTGTLKTGYNPVFVLNRRTLAQLRSQTASTGQFIWEPGLNGPVANTLAGHPYVIANSMADEANDSYSLAFGDFRRGYTIVDRTGFSVVRDEFTLKKRAIVEFTMNRWNTGIVTLPEAIQVTKTPAS